MSFLGSPDEYGIKEIPGTAPSKPPMYGYAKDFGDYLRQLIGLPAPSYQGSMDPGMSPTMQMMGTLAQMYANSPLPSVYGQAQGSLSRFLAPSFTNPQARMQFGAPSYFGNQYGPGQFLPGGSKLGELPYAGGMRPFANFTPEPIKAPPGGQMPMGPTPPQAPPGQFGQPIYGAPQVPPGGQIGGSQQGSAVYGPTPAAPRMPYGQQPPNHLIYE